MILEEFGEVQEVKHLGRFVLTHAASHYSHPLIADDVKSLLCISAVNSVG